MSESLYYVVLKSWRTTNVDMVRATEYIEDNQELCAPESLFLIQDTPEKFSILEEHLVTTDLFFKQNFNKGYLHCKIDLAIEQSSKTLSVFDLIYNFFELELKEPNSYLVKKLAPRFTESKKSQLLALILFTKNETGSLRCCVNYKHSNRYLFLLFSERFD